MTVTLTQTMNLVVQVMILALLGVAFYLYRKKQFLLHAHLMTLAFGLSIASFLLVMVPSLSLNAGTLLEPPFIAFKVASIIHIPLGIGSMLISAFVIFRWASNSFAVKKCFGKNLMRATFLTWVASILVGIVIYFTMTG